MNISESIEHAVFNYFSQWWAQHPYLAWSIAHPIPSLILLLLAIFFLWGLIKAIGRAFDSMLGFLLKTPFKLLQPIFQVIWGSLQRGFGYNKDSRAQPIAIPDRHVNVDRAARLDRIIDRLQILNQEQDMLLHELSTLTNSAPHKSENALAITDPHDLDLSAN
jgi:hypothetical protein